jgi:mono/diheme cytochrome c family protein
LVIGLHERGDMKLKLAVVALAGLAIAGAVRGVAAQEKTQWDGVYTAEQAKRGEALYAEFCAACHGPDLNGGEMAPSLTGGEFSANWNDLSLGQLFDRMKTSMPQNNPNSLSRQQVADVLAFMLNKANFPAGTTELSTQAEVLGTIKFVSTKPEAK